MTEKSLKLLFVDDNVNNLKVLRTGFAADSYDLYIARDGLTALQVAQTTHPDLVLLDVNMPGIGGFEVCRQLKASPETADIIVMFLSARDQNIDKIQGLELGGVDYITKPFDFLEVRARVKVQLTLREQQRQIVQRQQQDLQMLERMNEMKSEILGRLTHDVQSPVTNILLTVDMLKREGIVQDARGLQFLERITKSTQAIGGLFSNVIELAKSEHVPELQCKKVMIGKFINDIVSSCGSDAEQKDISITVIYENIAPTHYGIFDVDRMTSVLLNLISNAVKYSPKGGEIKISVSVEDATLLLKIADNGYGIHEEDLPNLFNKYFRATQTASDIDGTGLGLYIVKMIVEQHGGKVWVESEFGHGSTFYVSIPEPRAVIPR